MPGSYPRRIRKIIYKVRTNRLRRTGYFRRTGRSNRIFRRFISRRAVKPELKKIFTQWNQIVGYGGTGVGVSYTFNVTPLTMAQGITSYTRIGTTVKFVKVDIRLLLLDASGVTGVTAPDYASCLLRIIVWSPRIASASAATQLGSTGMTGFADTDSATIYYDKIMVTQPAFIDVGSTGYLNAGADKVNCHRRMSFKFPRKVHFKEANTDIDPDKDIMYITIVPQNVAGYGVTVYLNSRLWYFDS